MLTAVIQGDARMLPLADNSVDCIVTSPPYWGQRKYRARAQVWLNCHSERSEESRQVCKHRWGSRERGRRKDVLPEGESSAGRLGTTGTASGHNQGGRFCRRCRAWRGQLGLEPTPEMYVAHLVEIFREARRVLKPTGTLWLVISDSRPSGNRRDHGTRIGFKQETDSGCLSTLNYRPANPDGLKYSDMLGLPHDLVKALRADGWYWRDEIIWAKPNAMCESQRTRTTRNHEYVFLLTKSPSPRYYFDVQAIMEPCESGPSDVRKMLESRPRLGGLNKTCRDPRMRASALTNIGRKRAVGGFRRVDREGINSRMHQDRDVKHPDARKVRSSGNKERLAPYHDGTGLVGGRGRVGDHLGFNVPWEGLWRRKRSVWSVAVAKPRGLKHYATFPEKLVEPMILAGCRKGGITLDPFGGSGTVGVVARRLGRQYLLLDLSAEYCRMACKRLSAEC